MMEEPKVATTTEQTAARINECWLQGFAERPDLTAEDSPCKTYRQQAIEVLGKTAFPTRRDEDWRYSDFTRALNMKWSVAEIPDRAFDRKDYLIPGFEGYVLITVDGVYRPDMSDEVDGLLVSTVAKELEGGPWSAWLKSSLSDISEKAENAFVALNAAFAKTSLFIAGTKNQRLDKAIHIIHLGQRSEQARMLSSQVFIALPQGAELTIDETFATVGNGASIFRNHLIRADVASNARLAYRSIQTEQRHDYHHSNFAADQAAGSFVDHARVDFGGSQVRNNLAINHKAAGLETHLSGMFFARGKQQIDNQTFIDHAFPHGESNELYKGIVMDKAVTSFNGKVLVRQDAQKTNAYQQNDNLVIGEQAEANAKPQLEIFADDVKCSHGATIGQMDMAPVYYLMARGLDRNTALGMLQRGFLLEVLDRIESEAVRAYVEDLLVQKFAEQS